MCIEFKQNGAHDSAFNALVWQASKLPLDHLAFFVPFLHLSSFSPISPCFRKVEEGFHSSCRSHWWSSFTWIWVGSVIFKEGEERGQLLSLIVDNHQSKGWCALAKKSWAPEKILTPFPSAYPSIFPFRLKNVAYRRPFCIFHCHWNLEIWNETCFCVCMFKSEGVVFDWRKCGGWKAKRRKCEYHTLVSTTFSFDCVHFCDVFSISAGSLKTCSLPPLNRWRGLGDWFLSGAKCWSWQILLLKIGWKFGNFFFG